MNWKLRGNQLSVRWSLIEALFFDRKSEGGVVVSRPSFGSSDRLNLGGAAVHEELDAVDIAALV